MDARSSIFARWVNQVSLRRAAPLIQPLLPWLKKEQGSIMDFGCGLGHAGCLIEQGTGRPVTYLDVRKYPYTCPGIQVELFDGKVIPYSAGAFHTSLIMLVLHHTPSPRDSLAEVKRVTEKRIIVFEDLVRSRLQWYVEAIKDTIANGFLPHMTFQYKTEMEWEALFAELGLAILDKTYLKSRFIFNFRHVIWYLSCDSAGGEHVQCDEEKAVSLADPK